MQNNKRYVTISFAFAGFLTWLFCRHLFGMMWDVLRLPILDWPILPPDVIGAIAGIVVFAAFQKSQRISTFMNEVVSELAKVTWPPRKETILSTGVIGVVVAICAVILFGFDTLWGTIVHYLYK